MNSTREAGCTSLEKTDNRITRASGDDKLFARKQLWIHPWTTGNEGFSSRRGKPTRRKARGALGFCGLYRDGDQSEFSAFKSVSTYVLKGTGANDEMKNKHKELKKPTMTFQPVMDPHKVCSLDVKTVMKTTI